MPEYVYFKNMSQPWRWLGQVLRLRVIEHRPTMAEYMVRGSWLELTAAGRVSQLAVGVKLIDWGHDHEESSRWTLALTLPLVKAFIKLPEWLPTPAKSPVPGQESTASWGAETTAVDAEFPSQIYAQWGRRYAFIDLPWAWTHVRSSKLLKTGRWYHTHGRYDHYLARLNRINRLRRLVGLAPLPNEREGEEGMESWEFDSQLSLYTEQHPYCYVLRSGEAQDVVATVTVREHEARRRWLRWTALGARVRRSIDVHFSSEIGEGSGSWKGGVVGTGHDMRPGELPVHALARMQQERRFR